MEARKITVHFSAEDQAEIKELEDLLYEGQFASFPKTLKFCVTFVKRVLEMPHYVIPELPGDKMSVWLQTIEVMAQKREDARRLVKFVESKEKVIP